MSRGRIRSLVNQAEEAIYSCYKPGMDKHSMMTRGKKGGMYVPDLTPHVFSYGSRDCYLDVVRPAMRFVQENYPDIRFIKDVPVEAINRYLLSKAATSTTETLRGYASKLRKLGVCVNKRFKANVGWVDERVVMPKSGVTSRGERLRDKQISQEDYDACLAYARRPGTRSKAPNGWELSRRFGPRVSGCEKTSVGDVRFDKKGRFGYGQVHFCEKGGRHRLVDIRSKDDRDFLERLIEGKEPNERLVGIKEDSINKALNRALTALGIKDWYPKTSTHGLRKLYAGKCWDENRANGMSYMQNVEEVNRQLGHGIRRNVRLLKAYVTHLEKY